MAFKIRRGTNAERLTIIPAQGELIYTTDTKKLFVGDGSSVGGTAVADLSSYATQAYVNQAVSDLIGGAQSTLDTLKELADALGGDDNFAANLATTLAGKADTSSLATVATSGDYDDLTNKPTLFSGSYADLTNKPSLATVATSGSYADLTNKPSLATVATSGSYNDLTNKPSIPSISGLATETYVDNAVSDLVNGAGPALDTLKELADALGNDDNFASNLTTTLAGKANTSDLWDRTTITDNLIPDSDITYDIGSPTNRFKDIYLSSSTIYLGDKSLSIADNKLEIGGFLFGEMGNVAGVASTQYAADIVSIRVSVGTNGETIADSIIKGDKLKLSSPIGQISVLTVVSNTSEIYQANPAFKDYVIIVEQDKGAGVVNIEFDLFKPIGTPPLADIPDPDGILPTATQAGWPEYGDLGISTLRGDQSVFIRPSWDRTPTVDFEFKEDGTLKLPAGGDIVDSNGNSVLGGGASTGDIGFDGKRLYNTVGGEGITIDPSNNNSTSGYIYLPGADESGVNVEISNNINGGIRLNIGGEGDGWTFRKDVITFPDDTVQPSAAFATRYPNTLPFGLRIVTTGDAYISEYAKTIAEIDPNTMTEIFSGSQDDSYVIVGATGVQPLPWDIVFRGTTYDKIGIGSNSYVTFGGGTNAYNFRDDATMNNSNLPAIIVSSADNSYQRVYIHTTGSTPNREFTVRYQGTNATGGGADPNIVWQMTFFENDSSIVDLLIIEDDRNIRGTSGITDGTNWVLRHGAVGGETGLLRSRQLPFHYYDFNNIEFTNGTITYNDAQRMLSVGVTGGGADTADVTFSTNVVVGTGYELGLSPGSGFTGDNQYFRIRGGDNPEHLHFDTTDGTSYDLYVGDDGKYFKLSKDGPAVIQSQDPNTNTTFNWTFGIDGSISLPTLDNIGYQTGYTLNGPTLRLGVPTSQTIITGAVPTVDNPSAQRLVIQGQKGYGDFNNVVGEGGDVYIWGGVGGEGNAAGNGGDIKVRGGAGQNNGDGGYVRIEGGDAQFGNGAGGFIDINAGNSDVGAGGSVFIRGGASQNVGGTAGIVSIQTLNNTHNWTFGNDGSLSMPGDITQNSKDATLCLANADTVVYTSTAQYRHALKLFVMVEGFTDGGGSSWDTQACDVIAVRGYNNDIVSVTTYGVTYSGAQPIATFDGQWNATTSRIEITCRPTSTTNSVVASVHAIEMNSND